MYLIVPEIILQIYLKECDLTHMLKLSMSTSRTNMTSIYG